MVKDAQRFAHLSIGKPILLLDHFTDRFNQPLARAIRW